MQDVDIFNGVFNFINPNYRLSKIRTTDYWDFLNRNFVLVIQMWFIMYIGNFKRTFGLINTIIRVFKNRVIDV